VKLAGASEIYVSDPHPWRVAMAGKFGVEPLPKNAEVDIAFEAAWGGDAIAQAVEITCPGGRVVLVGIPSEDQCLFKHSTARRKGLTIVFSRRMKHTYPRAIHLTTTGMVDLTGLISHRFPLAKAAEAFALNAAYKDNVSKIIIESP
jgi:L-iditol 2-dehydrogenase